MNLDDDLRRAFTRQPAPPEFADCVLARLDRRDVAAPTRRVVARARRSVAGGDGGDHVVAIAGTYYDPDHQTIVEAERVQREVRLALQLTVRSWRWCSGSFKSHTGNGKS